MVGVGVFDRAERAPNAFTAGHGGPWSAAPAYRLVRNHPDGAALLYARWRVGMPGKSLSSGNSVPMCCRIS
ncbi:hypothetical protein XAPC_2241 [Xanthomonas citri pv. punicae str. LMG 859]|nr:hypothetical protein XAPC_2241 [Xanthomonas citri pv. punicae str. LMG 859]